MSVRRRVLPAVVALAMLAALVGCADAADNGASAPQSPGTTESAATVGGVQHITVDAGDDLRFAQTDLTAHTGTIAITLDVTGMSEHDLTFSDGPQGATSEIADSSTTVTLHFTKPGTYHFLCTVHPRMRGTLTVS